METSPYQKWVNLSYLALAALVGYIVFAALVQLSGMYDFEARFHTNSELIIRGVSLAIGAILFLILFRNAKANLFMNEVVAELSKVSWPTQKETTSATMVVLVMVVISGMILGALDYFWTYLLKTLIGT